MSPEVPETAAAAERREERSEKVVEKSTKGRGARGGKPDLNTMSVEDLASVEGFDETRARLVIEHRERSGGFKSWDDVREVEGIGSVLLEKLKRATSLREAEAKRGEERGEEEEEEKVNAIPFLMWQHREVESMFEEFEGLDPEDTEGRRSCFERIADIVAAHNEIEERVFYPGSKAKQTEQMLLQSAEEHLEAKRILAQLMDLDDPSSDEFMSAMNDLKEVVLDHVRREEDEVMPLIEQLLPAQSLEDMGTQMQDLYLEMIRTAPREKIPEQIEAPAPI